MLNIKGKNEEIRKKRDHENRRYYGLHTFEVDRIRRLQYDILTGRAGEKTGLRNQIIKNN